MFLKRPAVGTLLWSPLHLPFFAVPHVFGGVQFGGGGRGDGCLLETRQIPEETDEEDRPEKDSRSVHGERVAEFLGEAAATAAAAPGAKGSERLDSGGGLVPPADSECGEPGSSYTNPGPATPPPAPRREVGTGGESGAAGMGREAGSAGRRCGVEGGGGLGWWRGAAPPRDACELRTGSAPRGSERRRPRAGEPSPQTAPGGGLARAGTPTLRRLRCGLTVSPRQLPELS